MSLYSLALPGAIVFSYPDRELNLLRKELDLLKIELEQSKNYNIALCTEVKSLKEVSHLSESDTIKYLLQRVKDLEEQLTRKQNSSHPFNGLRYSVH